MVDDSLRQKHDIRNEYASDAAAEPGHTAPVMWIAECVTCALLTML